VNSRAPITCFILDFEKFPLELIRKQTYISAGVTRNPKVGDGGFGKIEVRQLWSRFAIAFSSASAHTATGIRQRLDGFLGFPLHSAHDSRTA